MFTQPEIVPGPPAGFRPRAVAPPTNRPAAIVSFLTIGVLLAGLAAFLVPTTSVLSKRDCAARDQAGACTKDGPEEPIERGIVPANAEPVQPRLKITGLPTPGGTGQVLFVTIRQPELNLLDWLAVRQNPAAGLYSHEDLFGSETPTQQRDRSFRSMRTAKDVAEFVAMTYAGYKPQVIEGDVLVSQVACVKVEGDTCATFAPADQLLDPGDKIVEANGVPIKVLDDLRGALQGVQPGAKVAIKLERDGKPISGEITTATAPDDPTRAIIGFAPVDTSTIKPPEGVSVDISTPDIGGPSAGLAFTLTLIDQLTEGNLLGGKTVAVTGTMGIDGKVGAIGGLSSKASAVSQNGADYFLVPTAQGEADIARAQRAAGSGVQIIPVDSIDEAVAALVKLGGDEPVRIAKAS
jgi:PDZ domain-containing protein